MIKAVIFDLDDTLIPEKDYINSEYRHIARIISEKYSLNETAVRDTLFHLFDISPENVYLRLFDSFHLSCARSDVLSLLAELGSPVSELPFYEDVLPVLSELRDRKIGLGIITDGYYLTQKNKIEAAKAAGLFDKIIITDELDGNFQKPDPRPFELMGDFFGVGFDELMYVGDNPEKDFYIGAVYPIKTVRIYRAHGQYHKSSVYMKNVKEKLAVRNLYQILEYLDDDETEFSESRPAIVRP